MSSLNHREIKSIERLVKQKIDKAPNKGVLKRLHEQYAIGRAVAEHILLTALDRKALSELVANLAGVDLATTDLAASRTDLASQGVRNEKLGRAGAGATRVSCSAFGSKFHYRGQSCDILPDVDYRVNWRQIDLDRYRQVLLVENFESFLNIHRINWDAREVLVIYRGHDASARAAKELLSKAAKLMPITGFYDPDPSGVAMALKQREISALLAPDQTHWQSLSARSHHERFSRQWSKESVFLERWMAEHPDNAALSSYLTWLRQGIAIAQEGLVGEIKLTPIPIRR